MEVVWSRDDVTVRDVHDVLRSRRPIAYTTVMTTMGRLADKGFLKRVESQQAHVYSPALSKQQYARSTVKSIMDWLVGQFREPTVAYFVDKVGTDDWELMEQLQDAIEQKKDASDER